jgi:CheY-like chemotaxis protein
MKSVDGTGDNTMMNRNGTRRTISATQPLRTVALIGRYAHHYMHDPSGGGDDYDIAFVESTVHAYSNIKRVLPDLVVMCLAIDDVDGCRLLSMLALDRQTARIPVLTYLTQDFDDSADDADVFVERKPCVLPVSFN